MNRRTLTFALIALLAASAAFGSSWYDDYDAGIAAAGKGQWSVVVQRMSAAIKQYPKEDNHARTYGAIFYNYHPYYYRGVANLNLGKYEEAIADLEKTMGPGEVNLGPIEQLIQNAKKKLEAQNSAPEPQPQPQPQPQRPPTPVPVPVPVPVQPAAPTIDPALRNQVNAALGAADNALAAARNRKATTSPNYTQAINALTDARTRSASARSNDDLNAALAIANNAKLFADSAVAIGQPPVPVTPTTTMAPRPVVATDIVLGDTKKRVRDALEKYFAGDFEEASQRFEQLVRTDMPKNGWLWAFLGASQYSQYAFEADPSFKTKALESFNKAKQYRRWNNGLPQKYFSKKIRKAFESS
jgi:tetratricopeptide (TPR) repeat protein